MAFQLLTKVEVSKWLPLDHTVAQAVIFPLVILLFARFEIGGRKIHPLVIVLGSTISVLGVAYAFTSPTHLGNNGILIARFEGDEMQNLTRIFRELVNTQTTREGNVFAHSYYESIGSYKEAREFLAEHPKLSLVTWGNRRWINIIFKDERDSQLRDFGLTSDFAAMGSLKIVNSVPLVGLSFQPQRDTARFVAEIALGSSVVNPRGSQQDRELALYHALGTAGTWTSFAHRGFAGLKLGNLLLEQAIKNDSISRMTLNCAISAYQKGLSFLRPKDDPELNAALRNNLGVAIYIRSIFDGSIKQRSIGVQLIRKAVKLAKVKNRLGILPQASSVAKDNLALVNGRRILMRNKGPVEHRVLKQRKHRTVKK